MTQRDPSRDEVLARVLGPPASPTRTEAPSKHRLDEFETDEEYVAAVRTEAEQAVLDEMRDIPLEVLKDWTNNTVHVRHVSGLRALAVVELARRGLKP